MCLFTKEENSLHCGRIAVIDCQHLLSFHRSETDVWAYELEGVTYNRQDSGPPSH